MKWILVTKKLSELKPYEKNPRRITEKGLKDLKQSINKFGIAEPIVINTDNTIVGGHARYYAIKDNGIKEVDCYVPEKKLTEKQCEELNIRLNKNIAGEWDFDILSSDFELPELLEWGFENLDLSEPIEEQKELRPFIKTHILISLPPDKFMEIQNILEDIGKIEGVEIEQSSN